MRWPGPSASGAACGSRVNSRRENMLRNRLPRLTLPLFVAAACSGDGAGPQLSPCTAAGFAVNLTVGQHVAVDPAPDFGCVLCGANATGSAVEYLLVPQLATGEPGQASSFQLLGDTIRPAILSPPAPAPASPSVDAGVLSPAERFHTFLRLGDQSRWRGLNPAAVPSAGGAPALSPAAPAGPPTLGSQRQFKVCAKLDCSRFDNVTATVRALDTTVAIYVDNAAPAGGLTDAQLDSLAAVFNSRLYKTDTAAFGRESDIDTNTVVIVLMTPVVNKIVTKQQCKETGYVAGFFLGADIDPTFQNDSRSNKGEVFYSFVADPSATLSCTHTAAEVEKTLPVTFIHEFQHMISYNQHVLILGGDGEVVWLNEGFSHYAEELGGRTYPSGSLEFSRFTFGDLYNAYQYLDAPGSNFLLYSKGIGSIAERGAGWLFVRYLVDRYSGGTTVTAWNGFTRQLLQTPLTGAQNIATHTGDSFEGIVTRWALTNWVSDLPAFTPDTALTYSS